MLGQSWKILETSWTTWRLDIALFPLHLVALCCLGIDLAAQQ